MDETVKLIEDLADAATGRSQAPVVVRTVDRGWVEVERGVIAEHGRLDTMPSPPGSLAGVKRAVLRIAGFNWARQTAVNRAIGAAVQGVLDELDEMRASTSQSVRRVMTSNAAVAAELEDVRSNGVDRRELNALAMRVDSLSAELEVSREQAEALRREFDEAVERVTLLEEQGATRRAEIVALRTDLDIERRHTASLKRELARVRLGDSESEGTSAVDEPVDFDVAELYARFEAEFRPSNALLEARFAEWADVLNELQGGSLPLVDVGAGRGEFVAVAERHGIHAIGVDLQEAAVADAQSHGRNVIHADAIEYLAGLESGSVGAVTAFHVLEHLETHTMLRLLDEFIRVLRPGGVVVVETPNPTNLNVGAAAFYHDPTHLRPLTPQYLEFLFGDRGFTEVSTIFLHPLPGYELDLEVPPGRDSAATRALLEDARWALRGPQDFAITARRPISP